MKLRTLLIVNAIVLGCSGILAVLLPSSVLSLYGVESGPAAQLMAQYAGLGSLVIALVAWFSRNVNDPKAQKAIILAFLISDILGVMVSLSGTISGTMTIGWAVVGIYLLFAIGYGYILFSPMK
ncbi:MAG: hypothetical protein V2B15_16495 [Bacteroidota bacterium]